MIRMTGLALLSSFCFVGTSGDPLAAEVAKSGGCLPTRLDYVVLASLADSPNWMSLSAYPGGAPAGLASSGRGVGRD
jgi:hypothetical protein